LYKAFVKAFNCLPVVAVIGETVVCMHAGISPSLMDLDEVNKKERPCEIPEEGWLCDFVWSDPDPDVKVSKL
jgi:serine/threonine-protein phosphatase PP1 catalytic subunit